jgi:hypothetical protein
VFGYDESNCNNLTTLIGVCPCPTNEVATRGLNYLRVKEVGGFNSDLCDVFGNLGNDF